MDAGVSYTLGLLHDIGRYEGPRHLYHVYAGYRLMMERGWPGAARVCLTHSFPVQAMEVFSSRNDCSEVETEELRRALAQIRYDDYDRLIQLCDVLGSAGGVCLLETRLIDVIRRYGVNGYTQRRIEAFYGLHDHFSRLCGKNVYHLFGGEVEAVSVRGESTTPAR